MCLTILDRSVSLNQRSARITRDVCTMMAIDTHTKAGTDENLHSTTCEVNPDICFVLKSAFYSDSWL